VLYSIAAPLTSLRFKGYIRGMTIALDQLAPGFLVAAPTLNDPNFERTLVLMCLHNDEGALGLVVNRPAPLTMQEILTQLELPSRGDHQEQAMVGGPVAVENGMLLYRCPASAEPREDEIEVTPELRLTPSSDLLQEIALGKGPEDHLMFLGHSGWGPGQLEEEISAGSWIPATLDPELIFEAPMDTRWELALAAEGINLMGLGAFKPQA